MYANKWKQEEPFIDMVFTTQFGKPIRYGDVNRTIKTVVNKVNMMEKEIAKREHREPFLLKPFFHHIAFVILLLQDVRNMVFLMKLYNPM